MANNTKTVTSKDLNQPPIDDKLNMKQIIQDVVRHVRLNDDNVQQTTDSNTFSSLAIHHTRKSYLYNSIMNHSCISNDNENNSSVDKIRIGPDYQAEIPDFIKRSSGDVYGSDDPEKDSLLLWKPQPNIDDDDLQEYLNLAEAVSNLNEERALGFLTANYFNLKKSIETLHTVAYIPLQIEHGEYAHIERSIFNEHRLDKIRFLMSKQMTTAIYHFYYNKQNIPPTVSEVLTINREEDTTIYDLMIEYLECDETDISNLDLKTIIHKCYKHRNNPHFDVTKLKCFQIRHEQINSLRETTRKIFQENRKKSHQLRVKQYHYFKFLLFLGKSKASSKWNIYEVIILVAIMDYISPKFCADITSKILCTKTEEQCQRFYYKHMSFLKEVVEIKNFRDRIEAIKMYIGLKF